MRSENFDRISVNTDHLRTTATVYSLAKALAWNLVGLSEPRTKKRVILFVLGQNGIVQSHIKQIKAFKYLNLTSQ